MREERQWWEKIRNNVKPYLEEKEIIAPEERTLEDEIKDAHLKWVQAQQYFDMVSEPALVDHATYLLQATRAKYEYLLSMAKKEGYKI